VERPTQEVDRLRLLFLATDAGGDPVVSRNKVKRSLPLLLALAEPDTLAAPTRALLNELAAEAGITATTDELEAERRLIELCERSPPDPDVLEGLRAWTLRATHGAFVARAAPKVKPEAHAAIPQKEVW
jgi:hypothetical protein